MKYLLKRVFTFFYDYVIEPVLRALAWSGVFEHLLVVLANEKSSELSVYARMETGRGIRLLEELFSKELVKADLVVDDPKAIRLALDSYRRPGGTDRQYQIDLVEALALRQAISEQRRLAHPGYTGTPKQVWKISSDTKNQPSLTGNEGAERRREEAEKARLKRLS